MATSFLLLTRQVASASPFHRTATAFVFTTSRGRCCSSSRLLSTADTRSSDTTERPPKSDDVPLYRAEGLFAVNKPLEWTSNDVVSYIRGILERDTRNRGGTTSRVGSRRKKSRILRVGHGGTLDPLATGVLVVGVGRGTKELQSFLQGSKRYRARGEFGFETTTLDMDGDITRRAEFDHITIGSIQKVLPSLTGKIQQIPPIFSALKKDGKKLYEEARKGKTAEDLEIQPREVTVYNLELVDPDPDQLPSFEIDIECGGGTFVRSLIRDIGYNLDSVATTTTLTRTKQGRFQMDDVIEKPEWNADNIYAAIEKTNALLEGQGNRET